MLQFQAEPEGAQGADGQRSDDAGAQSSVSQRLVRRLGMEGLEVVQPQSGAEGAATTGTLADGSVNIDEARRLGLQAGVDAVIWGTYPAAAAHVLEVMFLVPYASGGPDSVQVEVDAGKTVEDAVDQLAKQLRMKVLQQEVVSQITVKGNRRIEEDAIKRILTSRQGDAYLAKNIQEDLRAIYRMGYFDGVSVDAEDTLAGKAITFSVEERDRVREVKTRGNKHYDDAKILELVHLKSGAVLNMNTVRQDIHEIERFYKEEGYYYIKVIHEIKQAPEQRVDVTFVIEEMDKVHVKAITFDGNLAFDDKRLRHEIKTNEKGFFSWLTSSGKLDASVLEQDVSRLTAFYSNNGYLQARIGEPQVTYENQWIFVNIKIEEGPQFSVGRVDLEGDLIEPKDALLGKLKTKEDIVCSRDVIREDVIMLGDIWSDAGYAYADISPRIDQDAVQHKASVTFRIKKGAVVRFDKITIAGNTKTRDKVIRRELPIYEQELFSGKRLKRGIRNLYKLEYFDDIKVDTTKGASDDLMNVKIDVTEKSTGEFTLGGGYSSVDKWFIMGSISQRNLFGRGQTLSLSTHLGRETDTVSLSFTEPWLFDIPLTAGVDIYKTARKLDTYEKESSGGGLRLGYPVFDYTRASVSYNYERLQIRDLDKERAAQQIIDFEGLHSANIVSASIRRDSKDRIFAPTEGSDSSIVVTHAGAPMRGDIGYTRYEVDSSSYFPLIWHLVGMIHFKTGFINGAAGQEVPVWERYYLGGLNSVRGYDYREISPREPVDPANPNKDRDVIGGNKMVLMNFEILFPLVEKSGLRGVLFYDAGNAFDNGEQMRLESSYLKQSVGIGIRWYSPIGPLRLEYGYILDSDRKGEGGPEFAIGSAF